MIKTQSVCVFGVDHSSKILPFKLSEMSGPLKRLDKNIKLSIKELEIITDSEDIKELCTWIMKKIVRSGFMIYQEKERKWTRDLYPCFVTFKKYRPNDASFMEETVHLALNPTDQIEKILKILDMASSKTL